MKKLRDVSPTGIRILPRIKDKIKKSAKENHRSMGAEINFILERYFSEEKPKHV